MGGMRRTELTGHFAHVHGLQTFKRRPRNHNVAALGRAQK
jgi:hypothetical protein